MMDNQYTTFFSTHATVYGSHSAMFAFYWKREYFFFMCILNLVFFFFLKKKLDLCLFIYPDPFIFPQNCFSQNLFCFSYFNRGRKFFFNLCDSEGELLLFIGGVVSISYKVELFCVSLILYFLFSFIAYVYYLLSCLCQYVTKRGRSRWNVGILFVLFGGRYFDCLW